MAKNKNTFIGAATAVVGVAVFATTIGLVTRIRYTGENPRAELENLVSRVKNVAFKSDVFDNSTTYKQIKATLFDENGKLLPNIDLNKFISFYTTYNSKIRKFDVTFTPNKPFFEFVNLIPNDEDQSFELQFRAKHQLDNNYTAYSTILSKKITFAQRSQFALADFNANLEKITESFKENIQNLRKKDLTRNFASENSSIISQKIPSLTRVEDFASEINKSGTQEEAIEQISQYFPDFQKIIYELNDDKNNSLPFRKGKIFNFSLERHSGTNDFIALDSNSVPSFLVKAELTNDAKFELKGLNIQEVQMLEKVDLVPASKSGKNKEKEVETPKTGEQTEGESSTPTTTEGEKTKKTDSKSPSVSTKSPTYFADIDEILNKISLRKLEFKDFKVAPGDTGSQSATVSASASSPVSLDSEVSVRQVSSSVTPFEDASVSSGGTQAAATQPNSGEAQSQPTETQPAQKEDLNKFLTVSQQKPTDFLAKFNKKIYRSTEDRSNAFVEQINSDLLIKPISLDFGDLNPYFKTYQPDGIKYFFDVANAKVKTVGEYANLEIPVKISLFSSFFNDKKTEFLKSKTETFVLENFKKPDSQTESGKTSLDEDRKNFYGVDSLPEDSLETSQPVMVNASSSGSPTTEQLKEVKISSSTAFVSKQEIESLVGTNGSSDTDKKSKPEEIKAILGNQFQYAYDFGANESMLDAWVGKQTFPTLADFANFKENNSVASSFKVKSLKSDKFFKNDFDVAAFYSYLSQLNPAEVLEYLLEIAKANNLVDKSTKLNEKDIKDGNVFTAAAGIKFTNIDKFHAIDFNNQFLGFVNRGWISNLFLPKEVANQFTKNEDDETIFKKLNEKYQEVKIKSTTSGGGSGSAGSAVGGKGASSGSDKKLYGDLQEKAKKIKEELQKSSTSILKAGSSSDSSDSSSGSSQPGSIEDEIKKFFTEKTKELTSLKDLLLAFYFKAKELNNFTAWSKLGENLDYEIVFEKESGSTSSQSGDSELKTPNGLETYKLTYYYKVFDKKTKEKSYETPKTKLSFWVEKDGGTAKNHQEKTELNKGILSIPLSLSVSYLKKEEFEKIKTSSDQESSDNNFEEFKKTDVFKKIEKKVTEHNKDFEISVSSIENDRFNHRYKVVNLQIQKKGQVSNNSAAKSSLNFQIRLVNDDIFSSPKN